MAGPGPAGPCPQPDRRGTSTSSPAARSEQSVDVAVAEVAASRLDDLHRALSAVPASMARTETIRSASARTQKLGFEDLADGQVHLVLGAVHLVGGPVQVAPRHLVEEAVLQRAEGPGHLVGGEEGEQRVAGHVDVGVVVLGDCCDLLRRESSLSALRPAMTAASMFAMRRRQSTVLPSPSSPPAAISAIREPRRATMSSRLPSSRMARVMNCMDWTARRDALECIVEAVGAGHQADPSGCRVTDMGQPLHPVPLGGTARLGNDQHLHVGGAVVHRRLDPQPPGKGRSDDVHPKCADGIRSE